MTWQIVTPQDTQETLDLLWTREHIDRVSDSYERLCWLMDQTNDPEVKAQIQVVIDNNKALYDVSGALLKVAQAFKEQRDLALLDANNWQHRGMSNAQLQLTQILADRAGVSFEDMRRTLEALSETTDLYVSAFAENDVLNSLRQLVETDASLYQLLGQFARDESQFRAAVQQMSRELFEEEMFQSEMDDDEYDDDE